jgi:hypothetical protein
MGAELGASALRSIGDAPRDGPDRRTCEKCEATLLYLGRHSEADEDGAVLYMDIAEVQLRILADSAEQMRCIHKVNALD